MDAKTENIDSAVTESREEHPLVGGRYRVVRPLGHGGMGEVHLVEDVKLDNKLFAIKMLPSILYANKRAYRQLKEEALVAMKLSHPNIVTLRAFEETGGNPFLVMDYVKGKSLDDCLADWGTLTPAETVKLLKPVAAALDYAHSQGVVHRDIKPGNVMVADDGTPYVLDFGIAREIQETLTRVTGKMSSGTLLYMGPEQLNGDPPKPAQDVYSFAAMAYECIKGEPPFARGAIEDQIKNKTPEPLPAESPEDASITAGIMAGLAKTPEKRPATCAAVLEGAESLGAATRPPQRHTTPPAPVDFKPASSPAPKILAAVLAVGLAVAGGILLFGKKPLRSDYKPVGFRFTTSEASGASHKVKLPDGTPMELIYCAPGIFDMGSPLSERGCDDDENQHSVELTKGFWLGKYEVTQKQWKSVMGNNPSYDKRNDSLPVENVSWDECQEFCKKLNEKEYAAGRLPQGYEYRLPTEAEWEYACRAGTGDAFAGAGNLDSVAWWNGNSDGETHPVGQKLGNAWGFHDMLGNVWEWCYDGYGAYPSHAVTDPIVSDGAGRVGRGGSWNASARNCRPARRGRGEPGHRGNNRLGFRVALAPVH